MNYLDPAVYLLASKYRGVLYIGVTSNLPQRIGQHKLKPVGSLSLRHPYTSFPSSPLARG